MGNNTVEAYDTEGNCFTKKIEILEGKTQEMNEHGYYGKILSFGWPVEYYLKSLLKNYPFDKDLIIDMCGRNHKGFQVSVTKEDLNKILKPFKEAV